MKQAFPHRSLAPVVDTAASLMSLTIHLAGSAARRAAIGRRRKQGSTLRPGPHTPAWNALVMAVRPYLGRYGEKSKLARELGVPPQRIHEYFVSRTAAPDAERTLCLLHWLTIHSAAPRPPAWRRTRARGQTHP